MMEVKIRTLREDDAHTSYMWRNDPEVFKFTGNIYQQAITLQNELDWIRKIIAIKNDYRCAIEVDNIYVGNIYLTDISNGKATYHIFIGNKSFWGKGIAYQASLLIIKYAKDVLKLNNIELLVRPQNSAALRLYKRLGFMPISHEREFIKMTLPLS